MIFRIFGCTVLILQARADSAHDPTGVIAGVAIAKFALYTNRMLEHTAADENENKNEDDDGENAGEDCR